MTSVRSGNITDRAYGGDHDYWGVRRLLIDTYATTSLGLNWEVRRWDGKRWHCDDVVSPRPTWAQTRVWEAESGRIVAAVFPEAGWGDAHVQIHPLHRRLEDEVFDHVERVMQVRDDRGRARVGTFVPDHDTPRRVLLEGRGWTMTRSGDVHRRLHLATEPVADAAPTDGYRIRGTRPGSDRDCVAIAVLLNTAFETTIHTARAVANFVEHSPSFLHELNMVAESPDGTFAAHVGVNWDPENRLAIVEPVCTHPHHRRRGLALALIAEGLRRARALGARHARVATGLGADANALYERAGFVEHHVVHLWTRVG